MVHIHNRTDIQKTHLVKWEKIQRLPDMRTISISTISLTDTIAAGVSLGNRNSVGTPSGSFTSCPGQ